MVKKGDILVTGRNFGSGSNREHANIVLPLIGLSCVVAESVARIYFRNSIAIGFPIFQIPGITQMVEEGDELEIDMDFWKLRNLSSKVEADIEPYTELVQKILTSGGILRVLKELVESGKVS